MNSTAMLARVDELPRLPKAISELLEAVNNEKSTIKDISDKISQDQLVSARVLRMANSAYFGRSREVGSIDEAVIRLGMQKLRTLVIASAVVSAVTAPEGIDMAEFWGHTFEVACHAQEMAKRCDNVEVDQAFTCAILHNIGDLLIATIAPEQAKQINIAIASGSDKSETELEILGYEAAELGAKLAETWKFPPVLVAGIRFQNNPTLSRPYSSLAGLLYTSEAIIAGWQTICDTDKTSWLSQQANDAGVRLQIHELAEALAEIQGKGYEMGKMLA